MAIDPNWVELFHVLPDGVVLVDEGGRVQYVNDRVATLTGYSVAELLGKPVELLVPTSGRDEHVALRLAFAAAPMTRTMSNLLDLVLRRKDGSALPVDIGLAPFLYDERTWVVAVVRDDSARRAALEARLETEQAAGAAIAVSERRFRLSFENNTSGMLLVDPEGLVVHANATFCQMLGRGEQEIVGRPSLELTHLEDRALTEDSRREALSGQLQRSSYTKRYLHRDGHEIWAEVSRSLIEDENGAISGIIVSVRDLTEERALISQLSHQALHDPLTGLANRALFEDRVRHALDRSGRHANRPAVVMLDLDEFKEVNDTHGHLVGDDLLVAVARRLEGALRAGDTLSRFGGDEFCYLVEDLRSAEGVDEVASRLLAAFEEPFPVGVERFSQKASLGLALGSGEDDPEQLLKKVDIALYEAKRLGKGRHVVFSSDLAVPSATRVELEHELSRGLDASDLALHYQPIIDLRDGALFGLEALMRWEHPERGWVGPSEFVPIAERSGLIVTLGSFAIEGACQALASWSEQTDERDALVVSVNLSAHQLRSPEFLSSVEAALSGSELSPERLVLEITESAALAESVSTSVVLEHLRNWGVRLALDDFGTGYSSLSDLGHIQPEIIKIDPTFVGRLGANTYDGTVVQAIITLGHELGAVIVAKGIETDNQFERVRGFGCDFGQGHFFSPAVPLGDVTTAIGRIQQLFA